MKRRRSVSTEDSPVFFDGTGRRWSMIKLTASICSIVVVMFVVWMTPQILATRQVPSVFGNATNPLSSSRTERQSGNVNSLSSFVSQAGENNFATLDIALHKQIEGIAGDGRVTPSVSDLFALTNSTNIAVIGEGPLVRFVEITRDSNAMHAADPFTGRRLQTINDDQREYVNGDRYALQRYGQTEGRRIALTFDDGPDVLYTPPLLDLLARESARASFFVMGPNVARYPEVAERVVREGHTIANHTFTHVDFDYVGDFEGVQQINQTQRLIVATTQQNPPFFRPPYCGNTDQSLRNCLKAILQAQRLGYTVTSYQFDSNDWQFTNGYKPTYPTFDGTDIVVLVHDSGGDRSHTLAYVKELIARAKANGYSFASLGDLYPEANNDTLMAQSSLADHASLTITQATIVWPRTAVRILFGFSVIMIALTTMLNLTLATRNHIKTRRQKWLGVYRPWVTVVVPAYNEGKVIISSVRSLLQSRYKKIEIIIVDDGSTDKTWKIARSLERRYRRVKAVHQSNGGKASALNNAINQATGEIVVCVDADTVFPPQTIGNLVRHFKDESVGAVAGVVKVGNVVSVLTRWQMLEYTVSIAIDRNAHAALNSIMIIPGACGAWRKTAVLEAGGFSHTTLAEDCDLTIKIQRLNRYRILQDNDAISYTEAPEAIAALTKQRFRWMFGTIQSLWKHRGMIFDSRYRWLGLFIMPNALISIIIPLFFWPLLAYISIQNIFNGNYQVIVLYFLISLTIQFIVASVGLRLARERLMYLWVVPFARFIYGPIRLYILCNTFLTAMRGSYVGWNKLLRAGTAVSSLQEKQLAPISIEVTENTMPPTVALR